MTTASAAARLAFHVLAGVVTLYFAMWDESLREADGSVLRNRKRFGGRFQYLTVINHSVHVAYMFLAAFGDVKRLLPLNAPQRVSAAHGLLVRSLDTMFVLSSTFSVTIGILFWSIFAYDRELILPAAADKVYPAALNVYQHGAIAIVALVEALVVEHHPSRPAYVDVTVVLGSAVAYSIWAYLLACPVLGSGVYPYGIQREMTLLYAAVFYVVSFSLLYGVYA
eukprot:CAMPEP_0198323998 /NCGR_PEP_ID=MMETSP1450-20131203/12094_1 /TAXON_ID=753684 ORGANISM="Madagascaria erythrocladiodes, Strain CCMP3234" /NCGR_SAMPLE_ID=MMETSP1450 /ASSEMBLY_ACC=CAM_ASM_001115 /LENGTH=223 /DNA_ID=CAMNT_0044027753 /DNA_START=13 /DNA_END=681 /DNA_ORIENTATION=+